eukprot:TRINITY_DN7792_c0_g1_i1.p1 TRINITY_DN7792_c0_g1~~TRINITY_DN7792_c0_g1_i1.p1  ORF type:complete len:505 (-),score=96.83 TRINITY_DN7792_c0_g1_i1:130-1548(-)
MKSIGLFGIFLLVLGYVTPLYAIQQSFNIVNDGMIELFLTNFGFEKEGVLDLTVKNWMYNGKLWTPNDHDRNLDAFIIKITNTDTHSLFDKVERSEDFRCFLLENDYFGQQSDFIVIKIQDPKLTQFNLKLGVNHPTGFYNIFHMNCLNNSVSFQLDLNMYNVDKFGNPIFVSAGKNQLPLIYALFAGFYLLLLVVWIFVFIRAAHWKVNRTHTIILSVIISNTLVLVFAGISEHYSLQMNSKFTMAIVFYDIFTISSTLLFFGLIAVIANRFIDNEIELKKVFGAITAIEVLVSLVSLIIGEITIASQAWLTLKDICQVVDFLCCVGMVLYFTRALKELNKAFDRDSLLPKKFELFKQFYKYIVVYIAVTRVVLFFVNALLSSNLVWFEIFSKEMVKYIFYCTIAYKFNPSEENVYVNMLTTEEEEIKMHGLESPTTHEMIIHTDIDTNTNINTNTTQITEEPSEELTHTI